jgi:hypothetical protein
MAQKRLALCLVALLLTTALPSRPASARDLVKATAALVLAEEPPPTRTQILEKQRQEEAAKVASQPKKADDTPYYKKWWFWALSAAVVGGTVALGVWAVEPTSKPAMSCDPSAVACFGAGREGAR